MRLTIGATVSVALMTLLLTACGGGTTATATTRPASTTAASGGSATDASACATPVPMPRVSGTVATITGMTLALTQPDKTTLTVTTTATTLFSKLTTSSVSAIQVGDLLMAQGTAAGDTLTATTITDSGTQIVQLMNQQGQRLGVTNCPPAAGNANAGNVFGMVQKVDGATFSLVTQGGKAATVMTSSTTKVTTRQQSTLADVKVGDQVLAFAAAPREAASTPANGFIAVILNDQNAS